VLVTGAAFIGSHRKPHRSYPAWRLVEADFRVAALEVVDFGQHQTVSMLDIQGLQLALGRTAELQWLPPQPGDVPSRGMALHLEKDSLTSTV